MGMVVHGLQPLPLQAAAVVQPMLHGLDDHTLEYLVPLNFDLLTQHGLGEFAVARRLRNCGRKSLRHLSVIVTGGTQVRLDPMAGEAILVDTGS